MKIALCSSWDIPKDGIADYSRNLASQLSKGADIDIVKLYPYINDPCFYRGIAGQCNQSDICHTQYNYLYFNGDLPYKNKFLDFARCLKIPLVLTIHEIRVGYQPLAQEVAGSFKKTLFNHSIRFWDMWSRSMHKKIYGRADHIIVHTDEQARMINNLIDVRSKVEVIPHAVPMIRDDQKYFSRDQAKIKLGCEKKIVLTIFGFINKRKGYEYVLDILPQLPDNVILLIAGGPMTGNATDQGYNSQLLSSLSDPRLKQRVKVTGYLEESDIPMAMAATDIVLAPFLSDSASGALNLCIGYNKPVIASDIPANLEINQRIPCLRIFDRAKKDGLLQAIRDLIADEALRKDLTALTGQYAQRFSYSNIADLTLKVYGRICRKK